MDTVRRDHLELYGYDRPTMPKLAEWAKGAAVLDDTRSVAPWTLPSSRTILTGAQPERFDEVPSLARLFAEKGWVSAAVVGNVYLSSNSDMAGDWTVQRCINWPPAAIQVDRALDILAQEKDRPVFLELHFMDAHLPYGEPWRYHGLFAGPRPKELAADSFIRQEVMRAEHAMGEPGKQYLRDRYDQNLRYMDDEIARMLEAIGPDDFVVVLADHGEEFWDHGGFEHGHSLYDELLRVPLLVKGSSLPPGHYGAPTSLLDVAPTIARWAGLDESTMSGMPLDTLASDDKPFEERPQAFGRPLYGGPAWGVMKDGTKYVSRASDEHLFDLRADAHEKTDLLRMGADTNPWLGAMSSALGRPVYRVLRLVLNARDLAHGDVVVRLDLPGGVKTAWFGDAQRPAPVALVTDATSVVATWRHGSGNVRELYVVPSDSLVEGTKKLGFMVTSGKETVKVAVPQGNGWPPDPADDPGTLLQGKLRNLSVALGYGVAPDMGGSSVNAYTPEMAEALKALGYVDEDRAPTAPRQGPAVVAPDAASPDGSDAR
jgi:arylsulfatase A-like enzyme